MLAALKHSELDTEKKDVAHSNAVQISSADTLKDQLIKLKSLELMNKEETLKLRKKHVGPSCTLFFQESPLKMVKGEGQYLFDESGNKYLDCINNVAHVGHGNKRVLEAVSKQLSLLNTNSRFLHDNLSSYAQRLTSTFPKKLSVCYLVNSGSEANDLAIRLARSYTKRKDIVSVDGAYHGNLTTTMSISPYKTDKLFCHKQPKWAHKAPLPCAYRGQYTRDKFGTTTSGNNSLTSNDIIGRLYAGATKQVIEEAKGNNRKVAAFIVESMVSCGGQTPLPAGYLRELQYYLKQENILMICDEVQTGFGRCGKTMWAFQLDGEDICPDIVTVGKPMGNGFPCSAVITTPEIAKAFKEIGTEYFNTFGGNPASCAAAIAVLDELEERQLMKQADLIGSYILMELNKFKNKSTIIGDVRGYGYFIGIDIVESLLTKQASEEYAQFIVKRFRDEKILMSTEGKYGNVLKFKPPMVFSMEDAKRFLEVFGSALMELEQLLSENRNQNSQRSIPFNQIACKTGARSSSVSSSSSSTSSSSSSSSSFSSGASSSSWLESSGEM